MQYEKQSPAEEASVLKNFYWQMLAELDLTKHLGGLRATEELVELCHIDKDKYVLDVGCGVGMTPCYLARKYGCRVFGIDNYNRMIDRANERARRMGVEDKVKFKVADVQDLPFEDNLFDVVIGESIITAVEDKQRAINECVRVTKPGGYVGFNETILMKTPPPKELDEYLSRTWGSNLKILTSDCWQELLEKSGLRDIIVKTHKITTRSEFISRIRRYGLRHFLRVWYRFLFLYIKKPAYKTFLKEALSQPKELMEYWGYGLYVGRKC
ncbi:MAG: class I SAM-dependent methyltransferase [Candidatus Asgardarchaeia archaeon]